MKEVAQPSRCSRFGVRCFLLVLASWGFAAPVSAKPKLSEVATAISLGEEDKFLEAASKMDAAIKSFVALNHMTTENSARITAPQSVQTLREYRAYLRLHSYYYLQAGNYQEALRVTDDLLVSPAYSETPYEEEEGLEISRDVLFKWYLLKLLGNGDRPAGDRAALYLDERLKESIVSRVRCYTDFAQFLLGELSAERFLTLKEENQSWCKRYSAASKALAYFWIAQVKRLRGEEKASEDYLKKFLKDSSRDDIRERGIAFHQLNIKAAERVSYLTLPTGKKARSEDNTIIDRSAECACAMSTQ